MEMDGCRECASRAAQRRVALQWQWLATERPCLRVFALGSRLSLPWLRHSKDGYILSARLELKMAPWRHHNETVIYATLCFMFWGLAS